MTGRVSARADNGPIAYDGGSGTIDLCRGCGDGRRTWDDGSRSVELGSGPVAVTLSTVNGPVAVDLAR